MKTRTRFSARVWLVALMCSVALVTAGFASPAGATGSTTSPALTVHGIAGRPVDDATCPRDPEFPDGINQRQHLVGIVWTQIGPAGLELDLCRIFSGALGGIEVRGSFTVLTFAGILRGSAEGTIGFTQTDDFNVTLTVEHGSFLLRHVTGTLAFAARIGGNPFTGSLTPDLSFFHHPVRL